jgi:hypothetical protein
MRAGLVPVGNRCLSREQIDAIYEILRTLADDDADGARELNGVGFSKFDTDEGHWLAHQARMCGLTLEELDQAMAICRKYWRQIDPKLYRLVYES